MVGKVPFLIEFQKPYILISMEIIFLYRFLKTCRGFKKIEK